MNRSIIIPLLGAFFLSILLISCSGGGSSNSRGSDGNDAVTGTGEINIPGTSGNSNTEAEAVGGDGGNAGNTSGTNTDTVNTGTPGADATN